MIFTRILIPIDFSEASRLALRAADELPGEKTLTLLHVTPLGGPVVADFNYVIPPQELSRMTNVAQDELLRWSQELRTPAEMRRLEVVPGEPAHEIVRYSDEADLVVMGTHGRKGFTRFLMGSVAERVVRGAHCSVLVVRPRANDGVRGR